MISGPVVPCGHRLFRRHTVYRELFGQSFGFTVLNGGIELQPNGWELGRLCEVARKRKLGNLEEICIFNMEYWVGHLDVCLCILVTELCLYHLHSQYCVHD